MSEKLFSNEKSLNKGNKRKISRSLAKRSSKRPIHKDASMNTLVSFYSIIFLLFYFVFLMCFSYVVSHPFNTSLPSMAINPNLPNIFLKLKNMKKMKLQSLG
jgi:hypothetical protein